MFEIFYEFTFLNLLSIIAFVTTVGLFFCGLPICRQIWKRKDTKEISGAPFLMGVLGGVCWMTYGQLKNDQTVEYVTGVQIILYSIYSIYYWIMTKKKFWISMKIILLVSVCGSLIALVRFFGHKVYHPLGIICMTLNAMDFAAPLAGIKVVIRRRATSTLPLPLCIANSLVSTEWFLYGLLVKDFYLITPNGIGSVLSISQLLLFVFLPRKPGQRIPILRLCDLICSPCRNFKSEIDIEAAKGDDFMKAKRWSSQAISNITSEFEKAYKGEQFVFTDERGTSISTDSGVETPEDCPQTPNKEISPTSKIPNILESDALPPLSSSDDESLCDDDDDDMEPICEDKFSASINVTFPIVIRDPAHLVKLTRKLSKRKQSGHWGKKRSGIGFKKLNNMFETSLQPYHFNTIKKLNPFECSINSPIKEVDEENSGSTKSTKRRKRAKSEPNLAFEKE